MLNKFRFFKKLSEKESIDQIVKDAQNVCKKVAANELSHLKILNYKYTTKEAMEELGLDRSLVDQLVEDYVVQIVKAVFQFEKYLEELKNLKKEGQELDFTAFKELAHKNLGVAKNLRIQDAQVLLNEMMESDDLEYLEVCIKALKACSIKLKPAYAYKTLKLIEVKSSFELS